jgi:hypothetical protein
MSGQLYALAALFLWKEYTVAVGYEAGRASEPVGNQLVATELLDSYQKQNVYMCINFNHLSVVDLFNDNFIFY